MWNSNSPQKKTERPVCIMMHVKKDTIATTTNILGNVLKRRKLLKKLSWWLVATDWNPTFVSRRDRRCPAGRLDQDTAHAGLVWYRPWPRGRSSLILIISKRWWLHRWPDLLYPIMLVIVAFVNTWADCSSCGPWGSKKSSICPIICDEYEDLNGNPKQGKKAKHQVRFSIRTISTIYDRHCLRT